MDSTPLPSGPEQHSGVYVNLIQDHLEQKGVRRIGG
jgi:hypothetical protein